MSKSKVVQVVVGTRREKGKTGRNAGTGVHKLSHSKWHTYENLIYFQQARRLESMTRRYCNKCGIQFHSRSVYLRHTKRKHLTNENKSDTIIK